MQCGHSTAISLNRPYALATSPYQYQYQSPPLSPPHLLAAKPLIRFSVQMYTYTHTALSP